MSRPSLPTVCRLVAAVWVMPRIARAAVAESAAGSAGRPPTIDPLHITVVIPARDEADRIGPLLETLGGRYVVVVVDDGSTDDTAAIARRHGATVIPAGARPSGWAGKTWALHCGVEAATGTWIVHLDADVRPSADLPSVAAAVAERLGADLLSVATRVVAPPSARWLHGSMLATLVYRTGAPGAPVPGRELANGQVLVARRTLLAGPDGWSAVAAHVTEDVALARRLAASGRHVAMIESDVDLDLRVEVEYGTFDEVRRGWGRSIGLPGVEPGWRSLLDLVALTLVMPLPLVRLVLRRGDVLDVVLLGVRWGTAFGVSRAYRTAGPAVWLSPLADPLALALVAASAFRRSVTWRGRRLSVPRGGRRRSAARRRS